MGGKFVPTKLGTYGEKMQAIHHRGGGNIYPGTASIELVDAELAMTKEKLFAAVSGRRRRDRSPKKRGV